MTWTRRHDEGQIIRERSAMLKRSTMHRSLAKGGLVKRRRFLISVLTAGLLALPAAPAWAQGAGDANQSCVGWFASTFAKELGAGFGHDISVSAHELQPFGRSTVSPFAHLELEDCQG
jgi:hypothetical protein